MESFKEMKTEPMSPTELLRTATEGSPPTRSGSPNLEVMSSMSQHSEDYFTSIKAMCPKVETLQYTLQARFEGSTVDLESIVLQKVRAQHFDIPKLSRWARQGIELMVVVEDYSRRQVAGLDLDGFKKEIADWLGCGQGRIRQAFGLLQTSPIRPISKKREALLYLEGSFRGGIMGSGEGGSTAGGGENLGPKDLEIRAANTSNDSDYSQPLFSRVHQESDVDEENRDLEEVEILLQRSYVSPSSFNPGSSMSRYSTRSAHRRQSKKQGRVLEDEAGPSAPAQRRSGASQRGVPRREQWSGGRSVEQQDFRGAEEAG